MSGERGGGVWVNPKDPFDKVLIVSGEAIAFANPPGDKLAEAVEALKEGREDAALLLGSTSGTTIDKLNRISCNLKKLDVSFHWGSGKHAKSKSFSPTNTEQRDHLLRSLETHLGGAWTRRDAQFSPIRASVAPLVSIVVFGALTAVMYLAAADRAGAAEAEIHGRRALLKRLFVWLVETLGPTGVLIVGALITLALVAWLVVRVKNPPLMAVIKRA